METSLLLMIKAQAATFAPALVPARGVRHALARVLAGASGVLKSVATNRRASWSGFGTSIRTRARASARAPG